MRDRIGYPRSTRVNGELLQPSFCAIWSLTSSLQVAVQPRSTPLIHPALPSKRRRTLHNFALHRIASSGHRVFGYKGTWEVCISRTRLCSYYCGLHKPTILDSELHVRPRHTREVICRGRILRAYASTSGKPVLRHLRRIITLPRVKTDVEHILHRRKSSTMPSQTDAFPALAWCAKLGVSNIRVFPVFSSAHFAILFVSAACNTIQQSSSIMSDLR